MKAILTLVLTGGFFLNLAQAQFAPGGMGRPGAPAISPSTARLFGDNSAFSADVEMQIKGSSPSAGSTMPAKMAYDNGKSRFEMNLAEASGSRMPPEALARMKAMGMDRIIAISRPDKQVQYLVYPGLDGYVETASTAQKAMPSPDDYKVQATELGKETIDGHPCVKNRDIVTDKQGQQHEALVWNATDLKNFPIKMEVNEQGNTTVMLFKNVRLSAPDSSQFEPPAGMSKYDSVMTLMQQAMMKRMGRGAVHGGVPAPPPPSGHP